LNPASNPLNFVPGMSFGGVTGAASVAYDGRFPYFLTRYTTDYSDALSVTFGPHSVKAGVLIERMRQHDGGWATNFNGTYDFGRNVNNPQIPTTPYPTPSSGFSTTIRKQLSASRPETFPWASTGRSGQLESFPAIDFDYGLRVTWWTPFTNWDNKMATFVPGLYDPSKKVKLIYPATVNGTKVGINPATNQTYPSVLIGFIAPDTGNPTNGMVVTTDTPDYPSGLINNQGRSRATVRLRLRSVRDGNRSFEAVSASLQPHYRRRNTDSVYSYPIVQTRGSTSIGSRPPVGARARLCAGGGLGNATSRPLQL
jgi:hypothetical protein